MVREIVHCQVGQCGNQIGNVFWNTVRNEHGIQKDGMFTKCNDEYLDHQRLSKINVYFNDTGKRYTPRACLIDLEPGTMDVIKGSDIGSLFKPDNFIFGASGAGNNWAKGHYTEGAELIDEVVDVMRREMESCDCPQGLQITQSLGGGTGSGMGTLLLIKMRDEYPDRLTCTFSVYPSAKVSDVVLEPYNATLGIQQLLENSDETFVIDNESLFTISHNVLKQENPKYADLNWVVSLVMAGITASLRFSGKLNGDLRKMGVNLVPFPRLHFFMIAHAPLFSKNQHKKVNLNVQELTRQMFSARNLLAKADTDSGKYLCGSCGYRGNIPMQEVDDENAKVSDKYADDFISWIPNHIKSTVIDVPPNSSPISGTFVGNNTGIKAIFQRISANFAKMYKRKAFLHWYKAEGMDEMEFEEADQNIRDLILEYQDKENAVVNADDIDDSDTDDGADYDDETDNDDDDDADDNDDADDPDADDNE